MGVHRGHNLARARPSRERARGQNSLGFMYWDGEGGVTQDYAEAVRWYRLAAEQDYANAQYNLGVMYENGRGRHAGLRRSRRWYRLAAEQQNVSRARVAAQNSLA